MKLFSLAIHGGAGTLLKSHIGSSKEKEYHQALEAALIAGESILKVGGSAVEAVEAAVVSMEDSPLFNAGKGSVFTNAGKHELEASMMCGQSLEAGAVAGITRVKNPIRLCKKILEDKDVVYLIGKGAEAYADQKHVELVEEHYFNTDFRRKQLESAIAEGGGSILDHDGERKFGTVGAVALDVHGNLAAATSTGGLTNKKYGRVGDSSVIGSGCYADNRACAVSATGYGEYFLRNVTAHEIASIVRYQRADIQRAADLVIFDQLKPIGGEGGVIAMDTAGKAVFSFNSEGMYRGCVSSGGQFFTGIFRE